MKDLAKRLANLTPSQLALLDQKIRGAQSRSAQAPAPAPRERDGDPPLSYAQERLWFLDQYQPNNPAYNLSLTIPLPGLVNASAVEKTLNEIVRRHEALRTNFVVREGRPVQFIRPRLDIVVSVLDLRPLPEPARHAESATRMRQEALSPFDISSGPPVRALLVHYSEVEHVLLVTMHHIVSDGWSLGVFMDEFHTLYRAFSQAAASSLPELPLQYADFALWQRELLRGEFADSLLEYWRRQLAGAPDLLNLPTDHPMPGARTYDGAAQYIALDASTVAGLRGLAQAERATIFMVLLAGFKALLHRYTGQDDLVVGSPVANRGRKELEPLIGFFVNTLVLRTQVPSRCNFRELLKRVREVTIDAQAHQDLPFEHLVAQLLSSRDPSRNPLFQVMFALQNASGPAGMEKITGDSPQGTLGGQSFPPVSTYVKFDLTLTVLDCNSEMIAVWEYRTDLFNHDTITRMAGHFESLLRAAAAEPGRPLLDLPMLGEAERRRQLVEWNAAPTFKTDGRCLHELVEEQAERTPDGVALVWKERRITFGELNRRADNLAHHLRTLGVRAEKRVGVCASRSPEMVLGILATLKAGGAYVPLDPSYPKAHLAFVTKDAGIDLVLTQESLLPAIEESAAGRPVTLLCLGSWLEARPLTHTSGLGRTAGLDNIAYVIYTSGSTGAPKGVMVSHRAIVNHMRWMLSTWPLGADDAVLQRTPISFDASVWELFAPLMSGARMVLSAHDASDYSSLPEEVSRRGVTVMQVVPSLLRVLLEEAGLGRCGSLRRVYCGGEALSSRLAARFYEQQGAELVNLYGPTEAAIDSSWWKCARGNARDTEPIGRPISNARLYILDGRMGLVPPGATGELYIGGEGLAHGYLGRPELTAEAFVPDPFGSEPGARLYRTGDMARHLPDGSVEFAGRRDYQVKVRGFRIELTAVEATLVRHPDIGSAAVLAQDDGFGDRRLVAYVTAGDGAPPAAAELRRFLGQSLPAHMIPSAFVFLEELPLLPNGKINRAALAQVGVSGPLLQEEHVAPQDEIESKLADIWKGVLRLERLGVHDNFFALGGHSLLASQVAARLRDAFGIEFQLSQVFESPTIASLAEAVRAQFAGRRPDAPQPQAASEARRRDLMDNIGRLSEEEIDALILEFRNKKSDV